MRKITVKIYKFDELSKESQENVLEKLLYINTENVEWYNSTIEDWKEKLKNYGFIDSEIFFSISYSQGQGACFTSQAIDFEEIIKHFPKHKKLSVLKNKHFVELNISKINSFYSHEKTCRINDFVELNVDEYPCIINRFFKFKTDLENFRISLCKEIFKELKSEYESLTSDEMIKETIKANDYEFYENGEMFSE